MSRIYNMPSGVAFLRSLARGLHEHFGEDLQKGLVLLPTRRAARTLEFAFIRDAADRGVSAALLPRMRPLADVNPDEPPFEPGELAGKVKPAIDPMERRFEIAQLVAHYHNRASDLPLDPAAAVHMADPLIEILEDAALEESDLENEEEWQRLRDEAAIHFQHAATLYRIVDDYWPKRLTELKKMDPSARRVKLLDALAELWTKNPPDYPVIIAGSTGTLKATARLMSVVASLPQGLVILPGLQDDLPEKIWASIDERHPQASLKGALGIMRVDRSDVPNWPWIVSDQDRTIARKRRRILAEALVPVDATGDWLDRIETLNVGEGADVFQTALADLSLIEAQTHTEEALTIALILREVLESPGRTGALVTPDKQLANRVHARLARWGVDVTMSQGVPLEQTSIGLFLTSLLDLAQDPESPINLNLVLTHPLTCLGLEAGEARETWQRLERAHFRGQRPAASVYENSILIQALYTAIEPLMILKNQGQPDDWADALLRSAEAIATAPDLPGFVRLWRGDSGQQAAQTLNGIIDFGSSLPESHASGFSRLLSALFRDKVVRPTIGDHPRLQILGPLEARLLDVDVTILGGLNEGTWPGAPITNPFLSRGMRKQLKLSLPEKRFGLAAHDFAELAAHQTVYLTRAQKDESGPTVASRWVWRLKTLLTGAVGSDQATALLGTGQKYLDWARALDMPKSSVFIDRPDPKPPVDKRWARKAGRRISITGAARWIRDPYSLFGQQVLRLDLLDPLDAPLGPREFGNAIHKAIELYIRSVAEPYNPSNQSQLVGQFQEQLRAHGFKPEDVFKERPRLEALSGDLIAWFASRQADGFEIVGPEIKARYKFEDLNFALIGYLDLVEKGPEGFAFTDFKTGQPPSAKEVAAGFDLQLPLAGWLAGQGALEGEIDAGPTAQMGYLRTKGSGESFGYRRIDNPKKTEQSADALIAQSIEILRTLIQRFDDPDTGYPSQPRAKYVNKWGDYDDLARRGEWSSIFGDET